MFCMIFSGALRAPGPNLDFWTKTQKLPGPGTKSGFQKKLKTAKETSQKNDSINYEKNWLDFNNVKIEEIINQKKIVFVDYNTSSQFFYSQRTLKNLLHLNLEI